MDRLENWVGLSGAVLYWFRLYLEGWSFFVTIGSDGQRCRIPQESVLLFNLDMLPLGQILQNNNIDYHSYVDDTWIYLALSPDDFSPKSLPYFLEQINNWMSQKKKIQLNKEKQRLLYLAAKSSCSLFRMLLHCYPGPREQSTLLQFWLPVSYRIYFKVLLLVYKSLNGLGPEYIFGIFK